MVSRISNNMVYQGYLSGLNKALNQQTKTMEKILNGKLNRPSDNPSDTVLDMRYKINLTTNEQYDKNTGTALSWMNNTHDCMGEINDMLQRVRDLVVQAAKPEPDVAYEAAAAEIDELLKQVMQIGNTTLGDRYIFAGQSDRGAEPFTLISGNYTVIPPNPPDTVVYNGDDNKISMVVNPGSTNPSSDGVNITGKELTGDGDLFNHLIAIRDALRYPSTIPGGAATDPVEYLSKTALGLLDKDMDNLLTEQARLSAKVSGYEFGQSLLDSANIRINGSISKVEDIDIGEASIAFTIAQNCYNAALAMGSKILPMSLVNYL